ncbi:MAG: plasma-membrane proton-efflux P-type ATPase [Candidatus Micrarchaeaceae archaeon]
MPQNDAVGAMPQRNRQGNAEPESVEKMMKSVGTSTKGLSEEEAASRLSRNGYNEVQEKRESATLKFLKRFYGPIPIMLEAVVVLTYILRHYDDMYIILALLVFNAVVGFFEERKADNSIELLKKRITVNARVLRSGEWKLKPARELVIGDIIRIRLGDIVPADARIISESDLEIDQSVLTGESIPVKKRRNDTVYSGSTVSEGEALCAVSAVAADTYYGHTIKLVEEARPRLHLEHMIFNLIKYLIIMDVVLVAIILLFGIFIVHSDFGTIVLFALNLLIASVPVALPAAFTVSMALGTEKLSKKSILVTNLNAIEETSSVNVICFDKTGTITENSLDVESVYALPGYTENEVVEAAFLSSRIEDKDPIDSAVIDYAKERGISFKKLKVLKFTPFQPKTKMSSALVSLAGRKMEVSKGALEKMLDLYHPKKSEEEALRQKVGELSLRKFRTIVVARKSGARGEILGVIALRDEPRKDAKRLIEELHSLGVRTKMLTGDNIAIAKEIAKEVGIGGNIVDMSSISRISNMGKDFDRIVESADGFAGIFPEDKYAIVKSLQKKGYRVAMTGDGVNDSPALKQAEVGIAVSNATDVAKSVADLLLTRDGIEVLVDAVKESRRIFERMMTYTLVKIGKIVQIVFFLTIMLLAFRVIAIRPFELILLIFTNDIVNISVSTDNVGYSHSPDLWNPKLITESSLILGSFLLLFALAYVPISHYLALTLLGFQTLIFLMFNVTDQLYIFSVRAKEHMWRSRPSRELVLASLAGVIFGIIISYYGIMVFPISAYSILILIASSVIFILAFDYVKVALFRILKIR